MIKQAVMFSLALAVLPVLAMGQELERPVPFLRNTDVTPAEVVLPPSRPAKTQLVPGELERLRAVAAAIFKSAPDGTRSIGWVNVHSLNLKGSYEESGGLRLESVTVTRENTLAARPAFVFTILPDGRIGDRVTTKDESSLWNWYRVPLAQKSAQDALREELEFWLWGDGWRETTRIKLQPGRHHP